MVLIRFRKNWCCAVQRKLGLTQKHSKTYEMSNALDAVEVKCLDMQQNFARITYCFDLVSQKIRLSQMLKEIIKALTKTRRTLTRLIFQSSDTFIITSVWAFYKNVFDHITNVQCFKQFWLYARFACWFANILSESQLNVPQILITRIALLPLLRNEREALRTLKWKHYAQYACMF